MDAIQSLCRFCLGNTNVEVPLFGKTGFDRELPNKVYDCLALVVASDDGLPSSLCKLCLEKLETFDKFRLMCRKSTNFLYDYVSSAKKCLRDMQMERSMSSMQPMSSMHSKPYMADQGGRRRPPPLMSLFSAQEDTRSSLMMRGRMYGDEKMKATQPGFQDTRPLQESTNVGMQQRRQYEAGPQHHEDTKPSHVSAGSVGRNQSQGQQDKDGISRGEGHPEKTPGSRDTTLPETRNDGSRPADKENNSVNCPLNEKTSFSSSNKASYPSNENAVHASNERAPQASNERAPQASSDRALFASNNRGPAALNERPPLISTNRSPLLSSDRGQYASGDRGQYASGDRGQYASGDRGQYASGDRGQYASGDRGQYALGDRGQYALGDRGQYASGDRGQYASGDRGQYASGDRGQYASGDRGQYASGDRARYGGNERVPYSSTPRQREGYPSNERGHPVNEKVQGSTAAGKPGVVEQNRDGSDKKSENPTTTPAQKPDTLISERSRPVEKRSADGKPPANNVTQGSTNNVKETKEENKSGPTPTPSTDAPAATGDSSLEPPPEKRAKSQADIEILPTADDFGRPGCVISMANIPYRSGTNEIIFFFRNFKVRRENVIRKYNEKGLPTDEARVAFENADEARKAINELNSCKIRNRPIRLALL